MFSSAPLVSASTLPSVHSWCTFEADKLLLLIFIFHFLLLLLLLARTLRFPFRSPYCPPSLPLEFFSFFSVFSLFLCCFYLLSLFSPVSFLTVRFLLGCSFPAP